MQPFPLPGPRPPLSWATATDIRDQEFGTRTKGALEVTVAQRSCPKCDGEMVAGALLEKGTSGNIDLMPTEWVQFDTTYYEKHGYFKGKHVTDRRRVQTYRCTNCGLLESYAGDTIPESDSDSDS